MSRSPFHPTGHKSERAARLRACVLSANDGIMSTASLVVGVAAASAPRSTVLLAGVAGLMAGALSMAAGEFAAERALADAEAAELQRKGAELAADENDELAERTALHNFRGMDPWLACEVSTELRWHEAFRAPDRGDFGLHPTRTTRCYEAAAVSAASFAAGAFLPVAAVAAGPAAPLPALVIPTALFALGALGAWAAQLGGAPPMRETLRVVVWGAAAMLVTGLAGLLVPMRTA